MKYPSIIYVGTAFSAIIGGLLWIVFGSLLASSAPGIPGVSYRDSSNFMPFLGLGLLLVNIGASGIYFFAKKRFFSIPTILCVFGSFLYFTGAILRVSLNGGWEPAQPIGYVLTIVGLLILGITLITNRTITKVFGFSAMLSSILLLIFNDQFITAWASIPFGVCWIFIGLIVLKKHINLANINNLMNFNNEDII